MSRQEVAFLKEVRKIKGCGSLREDFYAGFIPIFMSWGCDMAGKYNIVKCSQQGN